MGSPVLPTVLYLIDDDDNDNGTEQNISSGRSLGNVINDNLPRKKRKLTNTNVCINPTVMNWSKRQRNDNRYQHQLLRQQLPPTQNLINYERETFVMHPDEYNLEEQESHSFHAFDWSSEPQTSSRIYSNPIQTISRLPILSSPTPMNVVKHRLDQSEPISLIPMTHQNDRYIQQPQRKSISIPMCSTQSSSLPLPLPTPTSSLIRPFAQRIQSTKNVQIPYMHSTPPPPIPVRYQSEPGYSRTSHSLSSTPKFSATLTPEIRRQALNGTGILSAFYDSKCYRCNICKFKSVTSSSLLQHLFTHIFFCHHCSFYTYSHHNLVQHIYEKHNFNSDNDYINPKNLDLLYITRCSDGTFALCMDTSPPKDKTPTPPPPPPPPPTTIKSDKQLTGSTSTRINAKNPKPKTPKKKVTKQKNDDNDIVILSEKRSDNNKPQPSSSSSIIPKRSVVKEKLPHTYVLMKHRRCYSLKPPPCLHSLILEYNICREHTIRHMCDTHGLLKRQKFKPDLKILRLVDEAAKCLKTIVNDVVDMEENRNSLNLICPLPNNIINLIFPIDTLPIITNSLKLNNKYDLSIEQNQLKQSEYSVRTSNQHIFILTSPGLNKTEQSVISSLYTTTSNADSIYTETKLNKLSILYDNTHRFLKGTLNTMASSTNSTSKSPKMNNIVPSINSESVPSGISKLSQYINLPLASSTIDRNNNSVIKSQAKSSSTPNVIVLD